MSRMYSLCFRVLQSAWWTSFAPGFAAHSLSYVFWHSPLHHSCWAWYPMVLASPKHWDLWCNWTVFLLMAAAGLFSRCETSMFFHDPFLSGSQLLLRLFLLQWPILAPHSARLFYITPLCFIPVPPGWIFHYQAWLSVWGKTVATSEVQVLCADSEKVFPQEFISMMLAFYKSPPVS